jgi:hypothetical protein
MKKLDREEHDDLDCAIGVRNGLFLVLALAVGIFLFAMFIDKAKGEEIFKQVQSQSQGRSAQIQNFAIGNSVSGGAGVNITTQFQSQSQTAKLPKELLSFKKIRDMKIDNIAYNVPSAMLVDSDSSCYLLGNVENELTKKDMDIGWIKIERKADGYYVYAKKGKVGWTPKNIGHKWEMINRGELIPVKGIIVLSGPIL